jgi:hypothetical protein
VGFWPESVPSERENLLPPQTFVAPFPATPTRFTVPTDASIYGIASGVSDVGSLPESVPSDHLLGAMSHRRTVTGSPAALQLAMLNSNQAGGQLEHFAGIPQPLNNDWTLYPHQERAVLTALRTKRHILGLAMGLGKTLIGCVWAREMRHTLAQRGIQIKIIVVCPVPTKESWRRTAQEATGLTIQERGASIDSANDVAIVSWAKVPSIADTGNQDYVVVADEAHFMQNSDSKRTEKALKLMLGPRAVGVLLLTVRILAAKKFCR